MKMARTAVFVLVGFVLGVVAARMRAKHEPLNAHEIPPASGVDTRSNSTWTGFATNHSVLRRASVPQRDLQPSDPRYNPVALDREANGELSTKEIFDSEPRDLAFAPIMEKRIQAVLEIAFRELSLEERIRAVHTECKTLSCYTRIEVMMADGPRVYDAINGILLGDVQTPHLDETDPDLSYVIITNLYRPDTRDEAYYKRFLDEGMRPGLEYAKQRARQGQNEDPR